MNDMKCPFCKGNLEQVYIHDIQGWACTKLECKGYFMTATKDIWQELIRTRKALDAAVDALKLFYSGQYTSQPDAYGLKTDASCLAHTALAEITATLENKNGNC